MGVLSYIVKRLGLYLAVLFIGLSITFLLPRLMPTNPIDGYISQLQARAGGVLTAQDITDLRASLEELYGLKGDLFSQYVNYLRRIVTSFDFGPSFAFYPQPVNVMIMNALPWTLTLLLVSTLPFLRLSLEPIVFMLLDTDTTSTLLSQKNSSINFSMPKLQLSLFLAAPAQMFSHSPACSNLPKQLSAHRLHTSP